MKLRYKYSDEDLAFLMKHDTDSFNRWEAGQQVGGVRVRMHCLSSYSCFRVKSEERINITCRGATVAFLLMKLETGPLRARRDWPPVVWVLLRRQQLAGEVG